MERLAEQDFAELSDAELLLLAGLMREISLAVPHAPVAPPAPQARRPRIDMRSTLRQARRTGGDAYRLIAARRARPRRLVVLCDISGSMEPYARAMIQLLYCAAGGAQAEVFTLRHPADPADAGAGPDAAGPRRWSGPARPRPTGSAAPGSARR